jgi:hypothetical protein
MKSYGTLVRDVTNYSNMSNGLTDSVCDSKLSLVCPLVSGIYPRCLLHNRNRNITMFHELEEGKTVHIQKMHTRTN